MLDKNKKILIVGLGLIGGSYARSFSEKGYETGAIDCRQSSVEYALREGIIAHGSVEAEEKYIKCFDIIVFALYPHVLLEWLEKYQAYIKDGAILTDVTGVKCKVVYAIQDMLRPGLEFIGAHPMAGREVYGVENSKPDLFKGANFIITPTNKNTASAISICEDIGHILGSRIISKLTPEEHDEMIGFLSQLTHCIAVSLMTCKESKHLVDYTGDSFRDLTRIAKINEDMWSELFLMNKDILLEQMDIFLDKFVYLRNCLCNNDVSALKDMMRLSTERRSYFDCN